MPANWKTTLAGILSILLPFLMQWLGATVPPAVHAATVPTGIGLILAKDASRPG